jgi:hypothetical protein
VFAGRYRLAPGVLDALKILKRSVLRWHSAASELRALLLVATETSLWLSPTDIPRRDRGAPKCGAVTDRFASNCRCTDIEHIPSGASGFLRIRAMACSAAGYSLQSRTIESVPAAQQR